MYTFNFVALYIKHLINSLLFLMITKSSKFSKKKHIFQRRQNGSVNFERNFKEYTEGFGDLSGEFWIGNNKLL